MNRTGQTRVEDTTPGLPGKAAVYVKGRLFLSAVLLASLLFSVMFSCQKYTALGYHTRDFAYYLQFASKVFDGTSHRRLSLNPHGDNFLFFTGTDGQKNFYQSIHFEPVKFVEGALYRVFGHPLALFLFMALVFFSPVVYLILNSGNRPRGDDGYFLLLVGLAYCLYPSVAATVSYDLRTYILLAPLFFLCFLSVDFDRGSRKTVVFFNLMFLVREEALVFGLIIMAYALARNGFRIHGRSPVAAMIASYLFWIVPMGAFFLWDGYENEVLSGSVPHDVYAFVATEYASILMALAALCILFALFASRASIRQKAVRLIKDNADLFLFLMVIVPLVYQLIQYSGSPTREAALSGLLHDPRYNLYFVVFLMFLMLLHERISGSRLKAFINYGLAAIVVLSLAGWFIPRDGFPLHDFLAYARNAGKTSIVFQSRNETNPTESRILVDYNTHQAFYDYDKVYVYNRLPCYLSAGDGRFFPQNRNLLKDLLNAGVEQAVISSEFRPEFDAFLKEIGMEHSFEVARANDAYAVYRSSPHAGGNAHASQSGAPPVR